MKHGGTGNKHLLLNLIFTSFLKSQKSSFVSHLANRLNVGTGEFTVLLTSAMVIATTIIAVPSPARKTKILFAGFSNEPFRRSKWCKVMMLPLLTPMKTRRSLLVRRFMQSCLLKGIILLMMSSLCSKQQLSGLLVMWYDQERAMMLLFPEVSGKQCNKQCRQLLLSWIDASNNNATNYCFPTFLLYCKLIYIH